jgi:NTE family protein
METVALTLGAGGARGLAHIHVLKAFDELGVRPSVIAGTSIGSVIGAAYCAGMSGSEIEEHVLERFNDRARFLAEAFKVRPSSLKTFLNDGGLRLGELNLESIFSVFLPAQLPTTFEDLEIPLHVVATDYYASSAEVFCTGALQKAIAASSALPAVFLPVEIDGRFYVDGSSTNPCPLDTVQGKADHILAIDVSGGPVGADNEKPNKIDTMYAASQTMQRTIAHLLADKFPGSVLLRAPVAGFRSLDFLNSAKIISETAVLQEQTKVAVGRLLQ